MKYVKVLVCQLLFFVPLAACEFPSVFPLETRSVVSSTLPVELSWTLSLDGKVTQSPLVTAQWTAIVTQNSLYLVDIVTGEPQWQLPNGSFPYQLPMVAVGDSLVIGEFGGIVSSLDIKTGQVQWQTQANHFESSASSFFNSVISVDDLVVVASQPTEITALSPVDGSVQWSISSQTNSIQQRGVRIYSYQDQIYISGFKTYAVDARTGKMEGVKDANTSLLQFADGYLFDPHGVYDAKTLTYQFDLKAPTQKLPIRSCDGLQLPYMIEHNSIIAADSCGGIYAMNLANGQVEWQYMPKLVAWPPIAVMNNVVYALMLNGEIHAIARETGENVGMLKTSGALAGYGVGELTARGIVTNGEVLVVTFNERSVLGLGATSD